MISNTFKEPNFLCKVKDTSEQEFEWITFAESEAQLGERLQKKGYTIISITPYNFNLWKGKAKKAANLAERTHQTGEKIELNPDLWTQLKRHLFELFHGKCAYCESMVRHTSPGDVEHYRPKRKPKEAPDGHPGYYWLAYDTRNLLPCCEECNRSRGKTTHFPVKNGFYAFKPDEVVKEEPLLLNPYIDKNPGEHLNFIPQQEELIVGTVEGLTDKGKESVKIYHLNRVELVEERRQEQENVLRALSGALSVTLENGSFDKLRSFWEDLHSGKRKYSAAALAAAKAWLLKMNDYAAPPPPGNEEIT